MKVTRNIWNHVFVVLAVVAYEQAAVLLVFGRLMLPEFIFYLVDIPFFYVFTFFLFNIRTEKTIIPVKLILGCLLLIFGFFLFETLAGSILQYYYNGIFRFPTRASFYKKTSMRCIHLTALSFAYFQAVRGIRKAREASQRELQLMEKERDHTELENAFLRSQVNPHLLFNTLQFIQHQVGTGSEKAGRAVELLGEVMHYSLGATARGNTVPLADELEYIGQYVELARLRSDNSQYFELKTRLDENAGKLQLPSGIIGNFIENIFKHGDLSERDHPAKAYILANGRNFVMHVSNLKKAHSSYRRTGIGMANVRKRLELLYPDRYTLKEEEENNHYNLYLEIEL